MTSKPLRVLIVEDQPDDAEMILLYLRRQGFVPEFRRVETAAAMRQSLMEESWDVVLSDYSLPHFNAPNALLLLRETKKDLPFIIVSGSVGEEAAVELLKSGADDYVMKDNLTRLGPVMDRAIREANVRREHRRAQEELRESEERYKGLIDVAFDGMLIHQEGVIQKVNRAFAKMFGYPSEDELVGVKAFQLIAPESTEFVEAQLREGSEVPYEAVCLKKDGTKIHVEFCAKNCMYQGLPARISVGRDITDRKRAEETILHQAYHDDLTGLPNRVLFKYYVTRELAHAHHSKNLVGVVLLELDRFKTINNTLGHEAGDQLLKGVSERLKKYMRDGHLIARMGGDEFMLLLRGCSQVAELTVLVERINQEFQVPWIIKNQELHVTCSMGIATYPQDGDDVETLLKNADAAVLMAKDQGGSIFKHYALTMNVKSSERLELENSLRHVLDRGEFLLYYQPQLSVSTGGLTGMEALVRWQHPKFGLMSPSEFIPLAENTGLITSLGEWILRTACLQTKQWHQGHFPALRVAVNLSARQFQQQNLVEMIARILKEIQLDPECLELEITESLAMKDADFTISVLQELKAMNIQIALDDFGTGYSSLSVLRKFPIHSLKIDQSFVRNLMTDPNDAVIAETVITLAHSLQLKVTAEGVETPEQLLFLKQRNCDQVQGYLFSKPVPPQVFESLMEHPIRISP